MCGIEYNIPGTAIYIRVLFMDEFMKYIGLPSFYLDDCLRDEKVIRQYDYFCFTTMHYYYHLTINPIIHERRLTRTVLLFTLSNNNDTIIV